MYTNAYQRATIMLVASPLVMRFVGPWTELTELACTCQPCKPFFLMLTAFFTIFVVEVYVELRCLRFLYFYLTLKAIFLLHFSAYYWYVIGSIPSVRVGIAISSLRVCDNAIPEPSRRASNHVSNIYYNLKMNKE